MATLYSTSFAGASLPTELTRRNIVSGDETFNSPGVTVANLGVGDFYLMPLDAAAVTAELEFSGKTAASMIGVALLDNAGNGVMASSYNAPAGVLRLGVSGFAYNSSFINPGGTSYAAARVRIKRTGSGGSTAYSVAWSTDGGVTWSSESASTVTGVTPTQIGIGCIFGSGATIKLVRLVVADAGGPGVIAGEVASVPATALDGRTIGYHIAGETASVAATALDGTVDIPSSTTYVDIPPMEVIYSTPGGYFDLPTPMFLDATDTTFLFSPISTEVRLSNATAGATATFSIDGDEVATAIVQNDRSVRIQIASGLLARGTHYIEAEVLGVTVRMRIIVTRNPNPILEPADADDMPVTVPEALQPDGRYKWVLQDLAYGGIGSWVMPISPSTMNPLPRGRDFTPAASTSVLEGTFHFSEAHPAPRDWGFAGFCPDFDFYSKLKQYVDLNRRFYLIDHRNRAWDVTFQSMEMKPRKRLKDDAGQFNDWAHDYTVRATVYEQQPKTPV